MTTKILLNVSARHVTMGVFSQRRLSAVQSFANDESGSAAFGRLLAAHPRTPVYLMADVVEEDFRSETLPHVVGRARTEMVARKLAQYFRAAPYRAAWRQGRAHGKRRDDQYLFLALSGGDLLRPYLELVEARRAPLAGIYLLPVVSQALVDRLKPDVPGVLLVSMQGGGLRQSFFLEGKLRISRLTPLEASDARTFDHVLADEIEKSRLFLYNSRLFSRDAPLQVWVLDPAGTLRGACEAVPAETSFSCRALGRDAMVKAFGMAAADLPQDMDALLLCLLGRHPPECSLALPRQTRGFAYYLWRHGIYAAAAAAGVVSVAWGSYNLYAHGNYRERATAARNEAAALRARYDVAARQFPAAPTSADNMRKAVDAVEAMQAHARTPAVAMRTVGQVLAVYTNVGLSRLTWRYGPDKPTEAAAIGGAAPLQWQEEVQLEAEIRPFNGDYREALRLIEHLAQNLRSRPGVAEVRVVELPVNLDSKAGLSGNTLDAQNAGASVAQFKLAVKMGRPE